MDDIYNMIIEFNNSGYNIKQISTITGYNEKEIEVFLND